jgi:hypothetical protein
LVLRYDLGLGRLIAEAQGTANRPAWEVEAVRKDPRIGAQIAIPPFKTLSSDDITLPIPQHFTMIVFVGNCAACAAGAEARTVRDMTHEFPGVRFYMVTLSGEVDVARRMWDDAGLKAPIVLDPGGAAAVRLNAIYNFRKYLFDESGRLNYLSSKDDDGVRTTNAIKQALGGVQR